MQNIIDSLNSEQIALLNLVSNNLFDTKKEIPAELDYNKLLKESRYQAVVAVALNNLRLIKSTKCRDAVLNCISTNALVSSQHTMLHNIMTDADIPYTVLKGASSAYYYPNPIFRNMGDVDFLVKREDVERATEVLKQKGFKPWEQNHICHIVFRKDDIHLEMHFEPAGIPNGYEGNKIREYISDMIDKSTLVKNELCTFMNPSRFHHGLIMLLHMQHHLLSEGIGLRHLCDWAVFVNSFKGNEFELLFEERLKNVGLWKFTQNISLVASIGIGLPYRDFMGQDNDLAEKTLLDILSCGNFGRKDSDRSAQGFFISNRGKDGVRHSRAVQFVISINQLIYTKWEATKKFKILLPLGWVCFGIKRLFMEISGKRKHLNIKKSYVNSKKRREIYKQFHLFEAEVKK